MMERLRARLAGIAVRRANEVREKASEALREILPHDVTVEQDGDGIMLRAKSIAIRWLRDPAFAALRALSSWIK